MVYVFVCLNLKVVDKIAGLVEVEPNKMCICGVFCIHQTTSEFDTDVHKLTFGSIIILII